MSTALNTAHVALLIALFTGSAVTSVSAHSIVEEILGCEPEFVISCTQGKK